VRGTIPRLRQPVALVGGIQQALHVELALIAHLVAHVSGCVSPVGNPVPLVSGRITGVRNSIAFVRSSIALTRATLAFGQGVLALLLGRGLHVPLPTARSAQTGRPPGKWRPAV
jgi:Na+/H+ antiporter NhaD/arsenite permease-like protein